MKNSYNPCNDSMIGSVTCLRCRTDLRGSNDRKRESEIAVEPWLELVKL